MEKSLATVAESLSAEKLLQYLDIAGIAKSLTREERLQFVEIAQAYQLNPFKREIYCNTYGKGEYRTTSIITGYEVYIKRAERTGKLNGYKVDISGSIKENNLTATITIFRKDWGHPFQHEVYFEEVCQKTRDGRLNSIWSKMPKFMTKKVAIAQGFRLCFSDELGGMPYTADELPAEEKTATVQTVEAEVIAEKPAPKAAPQANKLTDEDKAELVKAANADDLGFAARQLLNAKPQLKAEIIKAYNDRLAEIEKTAKGANND